MENGQDLIAFRAQCVKSHSDLLDRRLKNRERQRRYRARKRLEADSKKACALKRSTPQQVEELSGVPKIFTAKVYCKRNWKKDARNAHALVKPEAVSDRSLVSSVTSVSQSQIPSLLSEAKAESPSLQKNHSENFVSRSVSAAKKYVPNRRNWKAEARKKKI